MYFQHNARMAFAKYAIRPGPSTKYTTATVSKKGFIALAVAHLVVAFCLTSTNCVVVGSNPAIA